MKARVLLVHGLWMHAPALFYWARHLRRAGFEPVYFSYKSLLEGPDSALVRLRQAALEMPDTHILAHSLGGLVALKALAGESSLYRPYHLRRLALGRQQHRPRHGLVSYRPHGRTQLAFAVPRLATGSGRSACFGHRRHQSPRALGVCCSVSTNPATVPWRCRKQKSRACNAIITVPVSHSGQLFSKAVLETGAELAEIACLMPRQMWRKSL